MLVDTTRFQLRGFTLHPWQRDAVRKWITGDAGPYRGTLEIFTGGGKTLIALACAAEAAAVSSDFQLVVVVPTIALAQQWIEMIAKYTNVNRSKIRRISGSHSITTASGATALVAVINTAAKLNGSLPVSRDAMLVVDECHRAGAPTFRNALEISARFRLGLSATPEREEIDDQGEPLQFDEQVVAKRLGRVVFSFDLADARRSGWLPEYRIVHHGLSLLAEEQSEYDRRSRQVDDFSDRLRAMGIDPNRARGLQAQRGEEGKAARAYLAAVGSRKDLVYRARERTRIACDLVLAALGEPLNRIIVFNERIEGATELYNKVTSLLDANATRGDGAMQNDIVALEHSKLSATERRRALERFRNGSVRILISAKSLIEGIDVPEANVGISVASTGSVRQRIQALGRVLRRYGPDSIVSKKAEMHLLYVSDTVDEFIYAKEDWSDLTGNSLNEYLRWSLDPKNPPKKQLGPPRTPRPTEIQEYERLERSGFQFPAHWLGSLSGQEYTVDTNSNVYNAFGAAIANPQGVDTMLKTVRGTPGGRFFVTPRLKFVLVLRPSESHSQRAISVMRKQSGSLLEELQSDSEVAPSEWFVAGRLLEPFEAQDEMGSSSSQSAVTSTVGGKYAGPQNAAWGKYMIRSRGGGVIERRFGKGVSQFASTAGNESDARIQNALGLLDVWRRHIGKGIEFSVNDRWDAWCRVGGIPRFLAHIPGGFLWPEEGSH